MMTGYTVIVNDSILTTQQYHAEIIAKYLSCVLRSTFWTLKRTCLSSKCECLELKIQHFCLDTCCLDFFYRILFEIFMITRAMF